jgi:hypothetical protein
VGEELVYKLSVVRVYIEGMSMLYRLTAGPQVRKEDYTAKTSEFTGKIDKVMITLK